MKQSGADIDLTQERIWVSGHRGMVGSALVRQLNAMGCQVLTASRTELDLRDKTAIRSWMRQHRPTVAIVAAAKVGGILANRDYPVDFLLENLEISTNIISVSHEENIQRLLYLGSSCIYPKLANQPIVEDALLTGPLEPTNEWYAVAKIAGVQLCRAYYRQYGRSYISVMPTNLYGPGDNFDEMSSHVLPAFMVKMHRAKVSGNTKIHAWGTGSPRREFMHVDDLASACLFLLTRYSGERHVNIGSGQEVTIRELAELVREAVGYNGEIIFDTTKPDGTPRKLMDSSRLTEMGWTPAVPLTHGISEVYKWGLETGAFDQ